MIFFFYQHSWIPQFFLGYKGSKIRRCFQYKPFLITQYNPFKPSLFKGLPERGLGVRLFSSFPLNIFGKNLPDHSLHSILSMFKKHVFLNFAHISEWRIYSAPKWSFMKGLPGFLLVFPRVHLVLGGPNLFCYQKNGI